MADCGGGSVDASDDLGRVYIITVGCGGADLGEWRDGWWVGDGVNARVCVSDAGYGVAHDNWLFRGERHDVREAEGASGAMVCFDCGGVDWTSERELPQVQVV